MSNTMALKTLESMSESDFNKFLESLPERVKFLVRTRTVNWRDVLPEWYVKSLSKEPDAPLNIDDIPF